MNKAAIVIGVNKTGMMNQLTGASIGARDFAKWAKSQGFDVKLFSDDKGKPVRVGAIKKAIDNIVEARTYSQLIIFFAGHGILRSASDEVWLLSDAPQDTEAAVLVNVSKDMARESGIPHIVFISDACRSIPNNRVVLGVRGSIIFPNKFQRAQRPAVDQFYATKLGDPAYEVSEQQAVKNYHGLYTRCLLDVLNGKVPEVVEAPIQEGKSPIGVIYPRKLDEHLFTKVPQVAQQYAIKQQPDAIITSNPPHYIAYVPNSQFKGIRPNGRAGSAGKSMKGRVKERYKQRADLEQSTRNLLTGISSPGRLDFTTGFRIIGAAFKVTTNQNQHREREIKGHHYIQVSDDGPSTVLLQLPDQSCLLLAVLSGFIGTVVLADNKVITINYTPSENNRKYLGSVLNDKSIRSRRARIMASAQNGKFELDGDNRHVSLGASYLRRDKAYDPTLGLFAAYAYLQAGDNDGIRSVADYMLKEPESLLFDVALLGYIYQTSEKIKQKILSKRRAATIPLLTQGWAYLSALDKSNRALFVDIEAANFLSTKLRPGLWTTFEKGAASFLKNKMKTGNII